MNYYTPVKPQRMEHVTVYRNVQEYSSWPYNAGMWKVGEREIAVGFMNIGCDYTNPGDLSHRRVETFGKISMVRSEDGGRTWGAKSEIANNIRLNDQFTYGKSTKYKTSVDFCSSQTLLACWSTPNSGDKQARAWTKRSEDGGRSWSSAVLLYEGGIPRIQGRPSYLVRPDGVVLLFLTARPNGNAHDRPIVYSSFDGGMNWGLLSLLPCNDVYRMICPSPILLPDGTILVAVRCKLSGMSVFDELYASDDGGLSWRYVSRLNDHGDTCDIERLPDGRIIAVYGYRRPPCGIRAKVSEDEGKTWGPELILRDDGGSSDLGYPRCIHLGDGLIFTAYYFNDAGDPVQQNGGVRYIGGTMIRL